MSIVLHCFDCAHAGRPMFKYPCNICPGYFQHCEELKSCDVRVCGECKHDQRKRDKYPCKKCTNNWSANRVTTKNYFHAKEKTNE